MKKLTSILSLIVLVILAIWQYFTDTTKTKHQSSSPVIEQTKQTKVSEPKFEPKFEPQFETKRTDIEKSAVKNPDVFANYDVIMRNDHIGQNAKAPVDYYMLALSWSPGFCDIQREKYGDQLPYSSQYQCGNNRTFGWVVHGLWPQNANARAVSDHPRFCKGDLPALPKGLLAQYLAISPSEKLLQGEWEKHGSCAFDSAQQYFAKEQELFNALKLPNQKLSRDELFGWMKQHNPQLKNAYLRASRNELFICYDKKWQVMNCQSK
ncbi:ribonuclease HI [Haemophilus influenzae biotype aegyptius]|uniref:ribonuclease T2 family protein n=1 Tax=Haemophilus influenzae TaxID=727 RepID=UPI0001F362EC|nr:ribonuclease HI [Haemophilus influenzae]QEQ62246.1 ribonuclease HI [Haemophilus influenzae biotype aegyptius]QEQ64040.1 ribonuclease HI [Haemophilus influenzae biotype aegyptius]QEQ65810.1 ribonuclease HI [Haemophilus influenzae biotype aegyptius]TMQ37030.1 ribonuclease HI [Haemophilus influenzae biotype aegyptius]TMQ37516.1 ribonuclease HI [Haemophilus influenzae biotype aegyptius]